MKTVLKNWWWNSGGGGASYSSEFNAILTNATSRGYTHTALLSQTDAFIAGLVADGDWAEADIGYILATDQADFSRINIISPADYLATVGGTGAAHTSLEGWTSGGAGYLDTQWNLALDSVKYLRDSASIHIGVTVAPSAGGQTMAGGRNSGTGNGTRAFTGVGTITMQINGATSTGVPGTTTNKLYSLYRNAASGSGAVELFEDGVLLGSSALVSSALESITLSLLALNNGGTRLGFTDAKIGFVLVGSKNISPVDVSARWNAYKTAIGL